MVMSTTTTTKLSIGLFAVLAVLPLSQRVTAENDVDCSKNICELDDGEVSCKTGCFSLTCQDDIVCAPELLASCPTNDLPDCIKQNNGSTNKNCTLATCELDDPEDGYVCPNGCQSTICPSGGRNAGNTMCHPLLTSPDMACAVEDAEDCTAYASETNCKRIVCELDDDDGFVCPDACLQINCNDDNDNDDDIYCYPKDLADTTNVCASRNVPDCTISKDDSLPGIDCRANDCFLESSNALGHCPSVCQESICVTDSSKVCHPRGANIDAFCTANTDDFCGSFSAAQGQSHNDNDAINVQPASALLAVTLAIFAAAF